MLGIWHLTEIDWLSHLSGEPAERLLATAAQYQVERGARVFGPQQAPDRVFILKSGLVRIYRKSANADEVTFGYVSPGEIFGESVLFGDQQRDSHAVAVEPSQVLVLARDAFLEVMRCTPNVGYSVARQIGGRFKKIESRVEDLVFRNARNRMARILLQLAEQLGQRQGSSIVLPRQLTQQDLATLIGASRPTVVLALNELEAARLIARTGRQISIADTTKLAHALERL